jgi:hypothetical protein
VALLTPRPGEGRLDDALDGVTVTEIWTKRAVLEDGVDEQPGSD